MKKNNSYRKLNYLVFRTLNLISFKIASKYIFNKKMGYKLNLSSPKTFNEKLMKLKFTEDPLHRAILSDKIEVRNYVKIKGFESILVPIIGIYNNVEDIKWNNLPNSFVMKTTHSSGWNIIAYDKNDLKEVNVKKSLNEWMLRDYSKIGAEPHYQLITPRIIVEEFIGLDKKVPIDYKFHCFDGEVELIEIIKSRFNEKKLIFLDKDWQIIPLNEDSKDIMNEKTKIEKPKQLEKMVKISESLSKGLKYVRVDLYNVESQIYFGELTFTPSACSHSHMYYDYDLEIGSKLQI